MAFHVAVVAGPDYRERLRVVLVMLLGRRRDAAVLAQRRSQPAPTIRKLAHPSPNSRLRTLVLLFHLLIIPRESLDCPKVIVLQGFHVRTLDMRSLACHDDLGCRTQTERRL